jgi:hypothetical protein
MTVETNSCVRLSRQTHRINHTTIQISNIRSTKSINYIIFIIFIVEAMFPILPMRCCVSSVCGLAFKQSSTRIAGSSSFRKRTLAQSPPPQQHHQQQLAQHRLNKSLPLWSKRRVIPVDYGVYQW